MQRGILQHTGEGITSMSGGTGSRDSLLVAMRDSALNEIRAKSSSVPRAGLNLQQRSDFLSDQPRVIAMTHGGLLLNGIIVSPEQFVTLNQRRNGGSFPDDFSHSSGPDENDDDYVYLADVMIWTGQGETGWKSAGTKFPGILLRVPVEEVNCCGDNF